MVGERLFDKVVLFFSALVLSSAISCAGVQKSMKLQLNSKGMGCEVVRAEGKTEVMRCGGADYPLKRRAADDYAPDAIISMYERREGGKTYKARTEWYEGSRCPVSMDIDLDNGTFHVEFDEACNAWGIKRVKEVPGF
ncbi:hypothetical protein KY349_05060 [Candidatus Woesearchaeota archaeon]|nr:hypothetical protein [Candidatus Woesearchaeota archaeon]